MRNNAGNHFYPKRKEKFFVSRRDCRVDTEDWHICDQSDASLSRFIQQKTQKALAVLL